MGRDKATLPLGGRMLIEHVIDPLGSHFAGVMISSNAPDSLAHLGLPIVRDDAPGQGPLMGIVCALRASPTETNLIVPCDVPELPMGLADALLEAAEGHDAAVPRSAEGFFEPVFAVYRRGFLERAEAALARGVRKIIDVYDECAMAYVPLPDPAVLRNLNTPADVEAYLRGREG